nr:hypothetical protein GCM10020063_048260 [Dactylosporangium thailandense]
MTSNQTDGATLLGREVYDRDGDKIGSVGQVYADNAGRPTWASVSTGLLGLHQSLVPLAGATSREDGVQVPFDKATVKDAPRVDHEADRPLTGEQVQELYRHYQLQMDPASTTQYDRSRNVYVDTEPMDVIETEDDLPGDEGRRRLA